MTNENEFVAYAVDLMQSIGPAYSKKMFGGHGIFLEGLMFALVADSDLYFKVDAENRSEFEALGLESFTYLKKGKSIQMSYCQAPEDVMEDITAMSVWANSGYKAALRSATMNKKTRK